MIPLPRGPVWCWQARVITAGPLVGLLSLRTVTYPGAAAAMGSTAAGAAVLGAAAVFEGAAHRPELGQGLGQLGGRVGLRDDPAPRDQPGLAALELGAAQG